MIAKSLKIFKGVCFWIGIVCLTAFVLLLLYSNIIIHRFAEPYIYRDIGSLDRYHTGLLLGTNKYLRGRSLNPFYQSRIETAAQLYHKGKIRFIIASGANPGPYYNEPHQMKEDLKQKGVPARMIFQDYAGLRTLDSVVRCRYIFGQSRFLIISQDFHNRRAVYLARQWGMEAVGFNAPGVRGVRVWKTRIREMFAKLKAFLDIHIFKTQPRFLGKRIKIP